MSKSEPGYPPRSEGGITSASTLPPLPWYQSKVIVGALVSLVATGLVAFGLVDEISPAQQDQLAAALVSLLGAGGAIVSIVARLRQKKAPPISAGPGGAAGPLVIAFLLAGALPLASCAPLLSAAPVSPAAVADRTGADERGGIAIESIYTLAARTGALAFRSGLVPLPAQPEAARPDFCSIAASAGFSPADRGAQLMVIECRLRAIRDAGRAAYDAGNAASYEALLAQASRLADQIVSLTR